MASINITFKSEYEGRLLHVSLPSNFTMADFVNLIRDKICALADYRFLVKGKSLSLWDEIHFSIQRHLITNNCTIYVARRMGGGCFLPDTVVMRADNSVVPISTIQVGDHLLSFTSTGEIVPTIVHEVFLRDVDAYIELKVGEDKTVSVTQDHWIYVGKESFAQLGNLHVNDSLFVLSNNDRKLVAKSITARKSIVAPSTRVYNLHTTEPHTYFANGIAVHNMSGNMGVSFVDVSNESGVQHIQFSETAPRWRTAEPGLCLEGKCLNASCVAHGEQVIINIGFKQFDILTDGNAERSKCPVCLQYVEATTCAFNNCLWRWWGIKQPSSGLPPVGIPPCHWKEVGNGYDRFDEQSSGSVTWLKLILEAKSGVGLFM